VRIWATPGRIVVTVHDPGRGPADRLAGLVPAPSNTPDHRLGLGLWAMHQLDIGVALTHRRRLHRQAPQRNETRLSHIAPADPERRGDRSARAQATTASCVLAAGPGQVSGGAAGNQGAS
jgi:hypothetical protein